MSKITNDMLLSRAQTLRAKRQTVTRLEDELQIAKDNLKLAKTELHFAINNVCDIAEDATKGVQPLFNTDNFVQA